MTGWGLLPGNLRQPDFLHPACSTKLPAFPLVFPHLIPDKINMLAWHCLFSRCSIKFSPHLLAPAEAVFRLCGNTPSRRIASEYRLPRLFPHLELYSTRVSWYFCFCADFYCALFYARVTRNVYVATIFRLSDSFPGEGVATGERHLPWKLLVV